jgi:hypothetical protein
MEGFFIPSLDAIRIGGGGGGGGGGIYRAMIHHRCIKKSALHKTSICIIM